MAERPIGVTDQPAGAGVAQIRTRERTVGGQSVVEQYVIGISERVRSAEVMATTFGTTGVGTAGWNVASLFNKVGSGVLVAVKRFHLQVDQFGATATVRTPALSLLSTAPTTGTVMGKMLTDSAHTSSALVEFRGATASDGGAATTLTATAGTQAQRVFQSRAPSAVQQHVFDDLGLVPDPAQLDPVILREGEGLLVSSVDAASTSSRWLVNVAWEEYTLP